MSHNQRFMRVLCGSLVAILAGACSGEVTEAELDKWRHNEKGLSRMAQFVSNPEAPISMRVRALEVVVEKNNPKRIRGMLDELPEEANKAEIIAELAKVMVGHIQANADMAIDAKDALMLLQRYMPAPDFVPVRDALAKWMLAGLTWEASPEDVKRAYESRALTSGQVRDLGPAGWPGAAVILSHGFNVDKMIDILIEPADPKATALLLKGLKKRHANGEVAIHHLAALAKTEAPGSAAYLLDLYLDEKRFELDIRNQAFNMAMIMMDKKSLKEAPDDVVSRLLRMMDRKDNSDRWFGATNIVAISGVKFLDEVLKRFKDDKAYDPYGDPTTEKWIVDFCLDIHDGGHGKTATPILKKYASADAKSGSNRIAAAVSTVCLKAIGAEGVKSQLNALSAAPKKAGPTSLKDFMGNRKTGETPEPYTLQSLATNAKQGLAMIAAAKKDFESKKLDEADFKAKRQLIAVRNDLIGDEYSTEVETRFAAYLKGKQDAKAAADKAAADKAAADKSAAPAADAPKAAAPAAK